MNKIKRDSWADVKVYEYYQLMDILTDDEISEIEKEVYVYATLSGMTNEEIDKMPYSKFRGIINRDYPFFSKPMQKDHYIPSEYIIGGKVFKMVKNPNDITTAQFMDMDTLSKQSSDGQNLHIIAAVLFIPKGKQYGEYDVDDMVQFMKENLTMDIANNLVEFFFRYSQNALGYSMGMLIKESQKELKKEMKKTPQEMNMKKIINLQTFLANTQSLI